MFKSQVYSKDSAISLEIEFDLQTPLTYEWMDAIVSHLTDKPEATGAVWSCYPISQSAILFTGNSSYFKLKEEEINVVETRI